MKNLKLKFKFATCLGLSLLVLIITGIISALALGTLRDHFITFHDESYELYIDITEMKNHSDNVGKVLATTISSGNASAIVDTFNESTKSYELSQEIYNSLSALNVSEEFNTALTNYGNANAITNQQRQLILNFAQAGNAQAAEDAFYDSFFPAFTQSQLYVDDLLAITQSSAATAYEYQINYSTNSIIFLAVLTLIGTIMTLVFSVILTKSCTTPIAHISKSISALSAGNFSEAEINYVAKDEFGQLAANLHTTVQTLHGITNDLNNNLLQFASGDFSSYKGGNEKLYVGDFKEINQSLSTFASKINVTLNQVAIASTQIMMGSNQVANGAQSLAAGSIDQSSSIEDLSTSINEITDQIKDISFSAKNASEEANSAATALIAGNDTMQQLINSMNEIDDKSKEISKINKTIEDIAFQTNILALNAAVEAARAGNAGKGFAVVADEVRNLAAKSAEAAQSTNALIAASIAAINKGVELSQITADQLSQVVNEAQHMGETITSISEATHGQSAAIQQVTDNINKISMVIHANSATSEESAAASEELATQSNILNSITNSFKLNAIPEVVKDLGTSPEPKKLDSGFQPRLSNNNNKY